MTSRTRRNPKTDAENPKPPKINPSDEDDSPKKGKECALRRSLRHSPGESPTSPPRKTRRLLKESQESVENDQKVLTTSPRISRSDKSPSQAGSKVAKDLSKDKNLTTKIPRNISANLSDSSPGRTTRSRPTSISPQNTSKKKVAMSHLSNEKPRNAPKSRRTTRSKGALPEISHEDPGGSSQRNCNLHNREKHTPIKEESNASCHKRTLSSSPESSSECKSNGDTDVTLAQKHRKIDKTEHIKANGTSYLPQSKAKIISDVPKESNCLLIESNSCTSNVSSSLVKLDNINNSDQGDMSLSKRKLTSLKSDMNEEALLDVCSKRCKLEETDISLSKANPLSSVNASYSFPHVAGSHTDDTVDMKDEAELFLQLFGLSDGQLKEVVNLLPDTVRDTTPIEILEELVPCLLSKGSTIKCISSPRFNKLLRELLEKYCKYDITIEKKHNLCKNAHEWSKERKTVNLRHELELALMELYFNTGFYRKAEEMANALYNETKKLQDKEKTVKACLCLSKSYHAMGNISKARANITTAKTEALKIYTPPNLQAELDLQSGIMQVAEEKDMETAFSYFKEAATGFTERPMRARALKYMLLTKLLINKPEEGDKAIHSQTHVADIDEGVEALLAITKAAMACSLKDFKQARDNYSKVLSGDLVVSGVLEQLYSKMLEKNLLRIILPYQRLQISEIAEKISLERDEVERRLSQMILDKEVTAQLDHRDDCLYVYEPEPTDTVYTHGVKTVSQLDKTLTLLNRKVKKLL